MSKVNARILNKVLTTDVDFTLPPNDDYERFEGWDETSLGVGEIGLNTHRGKAYANVGGVIVALNGDLTITLNSGAFLTISANTNIELVDQDGNPITPDSVVGAKITVDMSGGGTCFHPEGAELIKTGQEASDEDYDDGWFEEGRLADFLTLNNAPLHLDGSATINTTTNRFTAVDGSQTYTVKIMLDWSTWNGTTIRGYYFDFNTIGNMNWSTFLTYCNGLSYGGYASGWRAPNATQMWNIVHGGKNQAYNYAPVNWNVGTTFWTSSSEFNDANYAKVIISVRQTIESRVKTETYYACPTRLFTLTGITLT